MNETKPAKQTKETEKKNPPWIKKVPNQQFRFGSIKQIRFPGAQHRG